MAVDTPAKIAILGAGPIGLEAALYARFLGYDVVIYDRGAAAENVRKQGDEPLRETFARLHSPLGLAAIEAQDENFIAPDGNALLSAAEWIECYLQPLADTDLLSDHLRLQTEVTAIRPIPAPPHAENAEDPPTDMLRVIARNAAGKETTFDADVVLDATGLVETPDGLRPDRSFTRELQLRISPATDRVLPPDGALGPQRLVTSEPHYYVLGAKSFGREPGGSYLHGLNQIRELFTIIGDRETLDLYRGEVRLND